MAIFTKVLDPLQWESFNEISLLTTLDHPGIVKVLKVARDRHTGNLSLVEPRHSDKITGPQPPNFITIAFHLLNTLAYLEHNHVIHGDIKPSNIVWASGDGRPILIDFGLGRIYCSSWTGPFKLTGTNTALQIQSPAFRAPEVWKNEHYDTRVDIWALGCTLFQLATDRILVTGMADLGTFEPSIELEITARLNTTPLPPGLKDLIRRMVTVDKHSRPFARELLKMVVFSASGPVIPVKAIPLTYPYPQLQLRPNRAALLQYLEQLTLEAIIDEELVSTGTHERELVGDTVTPSLALFLQAVPLVDLLNGVVKYPVDVAIQLLTAYITPALQESAVLANDIRTAFEVLGHQLNYATLCTDNPGMRGLAPFILTLVKTPAWPTLSLSDAREMVIAFADRKVDQLNEALASSNETVA